MTRLLVSVRNAAEATIAIEAGADVIDVKEPSRGPLGAADWATIEQVVEVVAGRAPVSAALGELRDWAGELPPAVASGLQFVKFGLAGCGHWTDWPARWESALPALGHDSTRVAVVYADWQAAAAPPPDEVLAGARRLGCGAVLVDTHDKRGGGLLKHWSPQMLAGFVAETRQAGMLVALAGGLVLEGLELVLPLMPDVIGVRGAACRGGRESTLDPDCVRQLARHVHNFPAMQGSLVASFGA